jgi:hypothetical protein
MREQFAAWQVAMIRAAISPDPAFEEYLDSRNRGGSKTRDNAIASIIVPAAEPATVGMWLSGNTHQLKQALRYVKRVHDWTFLGQVFDITTDRDTKGRMLSFLNGSELLYNASTATSGPRVNYLLFDEEGKITEKDKIENNRNSHGMTTGAPGRKRIRHFTTLAINTPAEEIYYQLEPKGLVFKHYPWDCFWWDAQDWRLLRQYVKRMPRWWTNQEYLNELDAPGGKILTNVRDLFLFDLDKEPTSLQPGDVLHLETGDVTLTKHWYVHAGIDWNASWGHTCDVALTDGMQYLVVDAFRGTDLDAMAAFILRWQEHDAWQGRMTLVAERQGNQKHMQSRTPDLIQRGVTVHQDEPFTGSMQLAKLTTLEGLNEHGNLQLARHLSEVIAQARKWHRNEETGLPAKKQDDHHCDAILHLVDPPRVAIETNMPGGVLF